MSEIGGSLLGHVESGNDSALQALFFVVIALFLGMQHHSCSQDKSHTEVQSSELAASAGTFTKQALAWIKIPFTALLLVTAVSLMAVSDFHSCFMSCCSKQMHAMTGLGSAAGNRQRNIHKELALCGTWSNSMGGPQTELHCTFNLYCACFKCPSQVSHFKRNITSAVIHLLLCNVLHPRVTKH